MSSTYTAVFGCSAGLYTGVCSVCLLVAVGVHGSGRVAVGYVRVSTDEQALGADAQRELILGFASSHGLRVVRFFEDIGVSGGVPAFERPGFREMLEYAESSGVRIILVYAIDRLGRSFVDIFETIRRLEERGFTILSVREEFLSTLDPMIRRIVLSVLAWAAEYERFLIRERTRRALAAKRVKHEKSIPQGLAEAITQLYRMGWGVKRIARSLGVSERQVRKTLVRAGLIQLPPDRCPRCFTPMRYDEQYQTLVCPNCGYIAEQRETTQTTPQ